MPARSREKKKMISAFGFVRLSRLAALAVAIGIGFAASASAQTWRMSTKMPVDSPEGKVFQLFADKAGEYSGGKLKVQVYPSEQLGKDAAVLEQLQIGTIHVYVEGVTYLQKWVPDIRWVNAPFLFENREQWVRFLKGPMVRDWLARAKAEAGIMVLGELEGVVRGPYRVMVTKKPVNSLNDVQGLKLRLHPDKMAADIWTALGAETRVLAWTETYESIKSGIVQAVNSPIALVESMRFYEVAPNVVRHNEYFQEIAFLTNAKAFESLGPDLQQALVKAHENAGKFSQELMSRESDESIARMKSKGVTFQDVDTKPFVARVTKYYEEQERAGTMPKGFLAAVSASRLMN
jgi:TRAP-type transport system periplasmic protein